MKHFTFAFKKADEILAEFKQLSAVTQEQILQSLRVEFDEANIAVYFGT